MSAKIIADSINAYTEQRIITFEVEFPRWILAEFNTHRQLSRNSASSRAIPIAANIENIKNNGAYPVHWGLNQAGMVADNEASKETAAEAKRIWNVGKSFALEVAEHLSNLGIHKQIANRVIETYSYQKVIVTATEWANFFWLRNHKDAQPEIKKLAEEMLDAMMISVPNKLQYGDWHVPYYRDGMWSSKRQEQETLENALKISASCCAQVSYRKSDDSLEKAEKVFNMLNLFDDTDETRKHASPVEHQATPLNPIGVNQNNFYPEKWPEGITHMDREGKYWSGNFKEWIQYRQFIPNESKKL